MKTPVENGGSWARRRPSNLRARLNLAGALFRTCKHEEAASEYESVLDAPGVLDEMEATAQ